MTKLNKFENFCFPGRYSRNKKYRSFVCLDDEFLWLFLSLGKSSVDEIHGSDDVSDEKNHLIKYHNFNILFTVIYFFSLYMFFNNVAKYAIITKELIHFNDVCVRFILWVKTIGGEHLSQTHTHIIKNLNNFSHIYLNWIIFIFTG